MSRVGQWRAAWGIEDVNLILPAVVCAFGFVVGAAGNLVGFGVALGSALAAANSVVLAKRVQLAVSSPNAAIATVSMQVGLMMTFAVLGGITLLTLMLSLRMAAAMAITFFVVQTAEIGLFWWSRSRASVQPASGDGLRRGVEVNR